MIAFTLASPLTLTFLAFITLFDKRNLSSSRRLAWLLVTAVAVAFLLSKYDTPLLHPAFTLLLSSTFVAAVYSYTAFQNMISERVTQRGSLQARLAALIMIVSMPLLITVSILVISRVGARLEQATLIALVAVSAGALLLLCLSWFTIRQAIQPIRDLTETAASIASGDLTRAAVVRSDDEIGSLARACSMTTQLQSVPAKEGCRRTRT
jgi:methyl-accepting chemotaxis protein